MSKGDWLLLLVLSYIVGLLFQHYWVSREHAHEVIITSPAGSRHYALEQTQQIELQGAIGAAHLEIQEGAVRFVRSPCRHQICVRSGWHRRSGAVAACVPNRISLTLRGGESDYDGYSY